MTIQQLVDQLKWLLDQRAAVYEDYSSGGVEHTWLAPDGATLITMGDHLWRLDARIEGTRKALADRREIVVLLTPPVVVP